MEAGCRGCHAAFDFGIYGLVGGLVAFLRLAVQVGGDGQFAHGFQHIGPGHVAAVPFEFHQVACPAVFTPCGFQRELPSAHFHLAGQSAVFPLFQVAHEAKPAATRGLLEHQGIVVGADGLQAKHFDECARFLAEMQARLDDLRVVEHHQRTFRQVFGE